MHPKKINHPVFSHSSLHATIRCMVQLCSTPLRMGREMSKSYKQGVSTDPLILALHHKATVGNVAHINTVQQRHENASLVIRIERRLVYQQSQSMPSLKNNRKTKFYP